MVYRSIPMLDLLTPDQWQLEAAAQAIEELMASAPNAGILRLRLFPQRTGRSRVADCVRPDILRRQGDRC